MTGTAAALLSQTGPPSAFATPEHAFCRPRTSGRHRTQPQQQATKTRVATALVGAIDPMTMRKQSRATQGDGGPACTATSRNKVNRRRRRPYRVQPRGREAWALGRGGPLSGEVLAEGQGTWTVRADPPSSHHIVIFTERSHPISPVPPTLFHQVLWGSPAM